VGLVDILGVARVEARTALADFKVLEGLATAVDLRATRLFGFVDFRVDFEDAEDALDFEAVEGLMDFEADEGLMDFGVETGGETS